MAPINLSNDTTNKHRRRLWRSSAWSTIHLSTMLLTQILLAPLEALSTRLILDSITDGSSVIVLHGLV
ncbi:hypothetical protein BDF19DRAFT_425657 [Syncephalis fuscata]|nr:hypothetical protein BDF19DRAFT_425657 [Syncephalis fuscata]